MEDHLTDYDDMFGDECGNCGGTGIIYMCLDEIGCIDPEEGCDLCARRCDWCRPSGPAPSTTSDGEKDG
jgi:hypothetical protein